MINNAKPGGGGNTWRGRDALWGPAEQSRPLPSALAQDGYAWSSSALSPFAGKVVNFSAVEPELYLVLACKFASCFNCGKIMRGFNVLQRSKPLFQQIHTIGQHNIAS
jgi:hypothetical protein